MNITILLCLPNRWYKKITHFVKVNLQNRFTKRVLQFVMVIHTNGYFVKVMSFNWFINNIMQFVKNNRLTPGTYKLYYIIHTIQWSFINIKFVFIQICNLLDFLYIFLLNYFKLPLSTNIYLVD